VTLYNVAFVVWLAMQQQHHACDNRFTSSPNEIQGKCIWKTSSVSLFSDLWLPLVLW